MDLLSVFTQTVEGLSPSTSRECKIFHLDASVCLVSVLVRHLLETLVLENQN